MLYYDEKYVASYDVDIRHFEDKEFIERIKKDLVRSVMIKVANKSMGDNGVNIKTIVHTLPRRDYFAQTIMAVAMLSYPKEHVVKAPEISFAYNDYYVCVWCGSRSPLDDKYHSGTCENCGGPKAVKR